MKKGYADIREGQMHYRCAGNGTKNIILLHMSGSSSDEYETAGNILAEHGYHVYAPDLLGFGSSDEPPCYYRMSGHEQTILQFMDALNIESAYFYGNLATANLCIHIGIDYPERVKGLMLANPTGDKDPQKYAAKKQLPEYKTIIPPKDGSHLAELWKRSYKYGEAPDVCDARCRCLHAAGKWGESLHWALFDDTPLSELLSRLKITPIIIAYEAFGKTAYLESLAQQTACHYVFDVYQNGTPYIARSHPEEVAAMITKYFG